MVNIAGLQAADTLADQARQGSRAVGAQIVDDAVLVWVVHDTNPHALSPKIKQFVQAQHWFQDLTTIGLQ